jgi:hypothetical protein
MFRLAWHLTGYPKYIKHHLHSISESGQKNQIQKEEEEEEEDKKEEEEEEEAEDKKEEEEEDKKEEEEEEGKKRKNIRKRVEKVDVESVSTTTEEEEEEEDYEDDDIEGLYDDNGKNIKNKEYDDQEYDKEGEDNEEYEKYDYQEEDFDGKSTYSDMCVSAFSNKLKLLLTENKYLSPSPPTSDTTRSVTIPTPHKFVPISQNPPTPFTPCPG